MKSQNTGLDQKDFQEAVFLKDPEFSESQTPTPEKLKSATRRFPTLAALALAGVMIFTDIPGNLGRIVTSQEPGSSQLSKILQPAEALADTIELNEKWVNQKRLEARRMAAKDIFLQINEMGYNSDNPFYESWIPAAVQSYIDNDGISQDAKPVVEKELKKLFKEKHMLKY